MLIEGSVIVGGDASGQLLTLSEPLSLWGGVDLQSGRVIDTSHPQLGANISGQLLVMPGSRGSSSSSSALVELARAKRAPLGIITARADPILIMAALVCDHLYSVSIPMLLVPFSSLTRLKPRTRAHLRCLGDCAGIEMLAG